LQKIENIPQQRIYDRLLQLPQEEAEALFDKVFYLFDKNILVDIYREYAKQRSEMPVLAYLEEFVHSLLDPLQGVCSPEEMQEMYNSIHHELLNDQKLAGLEPTVSVPHDFENSPNKFLSNINRQTTHVQHHENVQQQSQDRQNVSQQEQLNQYIRQMEQRRSNSRNTPTQEVPFTKNMFTSPAFGIPEAQVDIQDTGNRSITFSYSETSFENDSLYGFSAASRTEPTAKIWNLERVLEEELPSFSIKNLFDERLLTTSNAAIVLTGNYSNLLGPLRKTPWPVLLIRDEGEINPQWKLILCSIEEEIRFEKWLFNKPVTLPLGRTMWLLRSNGKAMPKTREWDQAVLEDPSLAKLFVEAMLFSGDWQTLSQEPWLTRLSTWYRALSEEQKGAWIQLFEKHILMGDPPGYKESEVFELLHLSNINDIRV
jgi:hypothetical protein